MDILSDDVRKICAELSKKLSPEKIYLFSIKRKGASQHISDINICLILPFAPCEQNNIIKRAYTEIDSDISFNLFLYTPEQFEEYRTDTSSFVSRILRQGFEYDGTK